MKQCLTACAGLTREARERVAWWLLDHAENAATGDRFDVTLESYGETKINVIKAIRANIRGFGIKEAKTLVESAPVVVKTTVSRVEAEALQMALEDVGASASVRPS